MPVLFSGGSSIGEQMRLLARLHRAVAAFNRGRIDGAVFDKILARVLEKMNHETPPR